jgi:hypothetical protein
VTGVVDADRRPVIADLMVVRLREHRHLRMEGAQIVVEQVVFIVAAKLRLRFYDSGMTLRRGKIVIARSKATKQSIADVNGHGLLRLQ